MTDEGQLPTVLFVDDDPSFLALVERALQGELWRVLTTSDPLRALPLVQWEGVDVLVADLLMPQVDGVGLLVRARELFPWIPRLVLSGATDAERALRTINEAEVFRFLRKPLHMPALREAVEAALRQRDLLRPAEAALADLKHRFRGTPFEGLLPD